MVPLFVVIGVLATLFVIGVFLTEVEHFGWATFVLIVSVFAAHFLNVFSIVDMVKYHAAESLLYALGYLVVGVVWSFVKWFSFLMQFRDKVRSVREEFLLHNDFNDKTPEQVNLLVKEHLSLRRYRGDYYGAALNKKPNASENKKRITCWMAFWPCSFVGTLLNDPVKRIFKVLFSSLKATYQRMSDSIFANEVGVE